MAQISRALRLGQVVFFFVEIVQERGAEGLEAWDEVSHFNAKKAHLLQAR